VTPLTHMAVLPLQLLLASASGEIFACALSRAVGTSSGTVNVRHPSVRKKLPPSSGLQRASSTGSSSGGGGGASGGGGGSGSKMAWAVDDGDVEELTPLTLQMAWYVVCADG
jgi:uncharacterized membrane protein YgcG